MKALDYYRTQLDERSVLWFAILCAFFSYPVIAADILHRDDLWRVVSGQYAWAQHGRPMAELATKILTLSGSNIIDTAPFTQIAFALCLLLSFFVSKRYFQREFGVSLSLPLAILFLNPFFLGNILYQYDAIGMGVAISLTAIAFAMVAKFDALRFGYSAGILAIALAIYQPMPNLLSGLAAVQIAVSGIIQPDAAKLLRIVALRAAQFIAGSALYYGFIGLQLHGVSSRSSIVSFDLEGVGEACETAWNFITYVARFFHADSTVFLVLFGCFLGLGIVSAAISVWQTGSRVAALLGILLAAVVSILSLFGPLILVEDMLVTYRTIPSSFAPLALVAIFLTRTRIFWPIAAVPLFAAVILSFQTMTAYKSQRAYDAFVAGSVSADLNKAKKTQAQIFTFGSMPTAPHARFARHAHPLIHDLAEPAEHWKFEGLLIQHGLENTVMTWSPQRPELEQHFASIPCADLNTLVDSDRYKILETGQTLFIFLPNAPEFECLQPWS